MAENTELNYENYHSREMSQKYMSYSQFKDFLKCEVMALAKVKGEYVVPPSEAMLVGSYVDAHFSGTLEKFIAEHPEMFNSKTGELKAAFKIAEKVIETYENDPNLKKAWSGKIQVIETGYIEGVLVKTMLDSLFEHKAIFDGKVVKSITEPVWVEEKDEESGQIYNRKTDFIDAYGYDFEGAIFQEIHRQNSGEQLPFILNVVTKEENPDKALIGIDQEYLDRALEIVKEKIVRYDRIKKGEIEPIGCGNCPVCRAKKQVTGVMSYKRLFKKGE